MESTNQKAKTMISIIIPVYNHASTLEKCVFSLFKQSYRPLEIIIINDGSTDDFNSVVNKISNNIQNKDIEVKIFNQKNQGAPVARNNGFKESSGEYIIFWDADTIADPEMLSKMYNILQKYPKASYAYSQFKLRWKKFGCREFDAKKLKKFNYIDLSALIRRGDFSGFDESLKRFMDWDLWLTMLEKNKTGIFLPEVLYKRMVAKRRKGISNWLPSFIYKLPWKTKSVKDYENAREIILKKHGIKDIKKILKRY